MFCHLRVWDKIHRAPVEAVWVPKTPTYTLEVDVIDPQSREDLLKAPWTYPGPASTSLPDDPIGFFMAET